jgi:hypothetical protein
METTPYSCKEDSEKVFSEDPRVYSCNTDRDLQINKSDESSSINYGADEEE